MSIPVNEQETVVNYSRDEDTMTIWTNDSTQMTRLRKLSEKSPDIYQITDIGKSRNGELLCMTFKAPKAMLSFRSVRRSRELSPEQIDAMRNRYMKNLHGGK